MIYIYLRGNPFVLVCVQQWTYYAAGVVCVCLVAPNLWFGLGYAHTGSTGIRLRQGWWWLGLLLLLLLLLLGFGHNRHRLDKRIHLGTLRY
jgi:hypothetical protein